VAKSVLTQVFLSLGGTDVSAYCTKAEFKRATEDKETTTFGSLGAKEFIGGLKSGSLELEFLNDFATGLLDQIMDALVGTVVAFEIRPTQAVVGVSNPKRTGNVLIDSWDAISGSVGDVASVACSYPTTGVVTRATA